MAVRWFFVLMTLIAVCPVSSCGQGAVAPGARSPAEPTQPQPQAQPQAIAVSSGFVCYRYSDQNDELSMTYCHGSAEECEGRRARAASLKSVAGTSACTPQASAFCARINDSPTKTEAIVCFPSRDECTARLAWFKVAGRECAPFSSRAEADARL
jgi:hypothetical protein